ncbi:DUF3040 domain-containing protein [Mangrovihabitans endophyticus]|uniref:DUF3040 domain-containing protein n=1 Tax=Mangrovihabitans endophyticus TaxID=1751298 RepID=A0A8J3C3X3_9ACTN|nr:DUF3040 domain-containing protein [Mangrovihabitans endophyticus]GGL05819.1 hypothetical protein GCM10012284_45190 [Mangrovihabitans endophyticus]
MLDPEEKLAFDCMVTQLRADDPQFHRRTDQILRPRRRLRMIAAVVLWTMAPVCVLLGGWTGLIVAAISVWYGIHLLTKVPGSVTTPLGAATRRLPGASI